LAQAARESGIGERTLRRWLAEDDEFRRSVEVARTEVLEEAIQAMRHATRSAVDTLRGVMEDQEAPASARIAAARSILDRAFDLGLAQRVAELEERMEREAESKSRARQWDSLLNPLGI
jgi:chloramphenicol 3-O-phosphotransferase